MGFPGQGPEAIASGRPHCAGISPRFLSNLAGFSAFFLYVLFDFVSFSIFFFFGCGQSRSDGTNQLFNKPRLLPSQSAILIPTPSRISIQASAPNPSSVSAFCFMRQYSVFSTAQKYCLPSSPYLAFDRRNYLQALL